MKWILPPGPATAYLRDSRPIFEAGEIIHQKKEGTHDSLTYHKVHFIMIVQRTKQNGVITYLEWTESRKGYWMYLASPWLLNSKNLLLEKDWNVRVKMQVKQWQYGDGIGLGLAWFHL